MNFSDMESAIDNIVKETKGSTWTPGTTIRNAFSHLHAMQQAGVMTMLAKDHEKTVKSELKGGKKKEKDPDAPKKEESSWIKYVKEIWHESGYKLDEKGQVMKNKNGEPVCNMDYSEALKIASQRKKEMEARGEGLVSTKATKMTSQATITSSSAREKMTAPPTKVAKVEIPPVEEESYDEELNLWSHPTTGKLYWKSTMNECWIANNRDHSRGAWMGIYNPVTRKFDPADEPDI